MLHRKIEYSCHDKTLNKAAVDVWKKHAYEETYLWVGSVIKRLFAQVQNIICLVLSNEIKILENSGKSSRLAPQ